MPDSLAPGPFFAVGVWRSGTSLLYALLNQHPQIALLYEGDLPLLGPFFRAPGGRAHWSERWEFWGGALHRHQLDSASFSEGLDEEIGATRAIYRQFAERKGARIWGDKSPTYYVELLRLAEAFPDARFLVIWRGPEGILRSIRRAADKSHWFRKRGMVLRALMGCREMKRQCDELRRRGIAVHEIHYEELVRDPEPVMRSICDYLEIAYDPAMTSLAGADRSAIADGEHHAMVRSGRVAADDQQREVLAPALRAKAHRYMNLWRQETGGDWPRYPQAADAAAGLPSFMERGADRLRYTLFRTFDRLVLLLYSVAPLGLLQRYRDWSRREVRSGTAGGDR
jgi:hypothetical protein